MNLERALRVGDRLGGHIVQGHVDGVATVRDTREDGFARVVHFANQTVDLYYLGLLESDPLVRGVFRVGAEAQRALTELTEATRALAWISSRISASPRVCSCEWPCS